MDHKRRDATGLVFEIIGAARKGTQKTHIVSRTNLNSKIITPYLDYLIEKGLMVVGATDRRQYVYCLTKEGNEFLILLSRVEIVLKGLFANSRKR